jgi:hypothetical protein
LQQVSIFPWFGAVASRSTILQFAILSGCPLAASQVVLKLHSLDVHISDFSFFIYFQVRKPAGKGPSP